MTSSLSVYSASNPPVMYMTSGSDFNLTSGFNGLHVYDVNGNHQSPEVTTGSTNGVSRRISCSDPGLSGSTYTQVHKYIPSSTKITGSAKPEMTGSTKPEVTGISPNAAPFIPKKHIRNNNNIYPTCPNGKSSLV